MGNTNLENVRINTRLLEGRLSSPVDPHTEKVLIKQHDRYYYEKYTRYNSTARKKE